MKQRLLGVFAAVIFLMPVLGAAAYATQDTTVADAAPTIKAPATTTVTTSANAAAALAARLSAREAALKTKLSAAVQKRIQTKCKAAQTLVSAATVKSAAAIDSRTKVYGSINTKLASTIKKLDAQSVDVSSLTPFQTQLTAQTATFTTDAATLQQTLADLSGMDCVTDPTGFQATLDTARTERTALVTDSSNIKASVTQVIATLEVLAPKIPDDNVVNHSGNK